jgi:uncharacterized protein (DUF1800 family)
VTIHTRRTFLQTAGTFGVLASLGVFGRGCQRLEESALDAAFGPDDGPFRPPQGDSIDEVTHALQRLAFGARLGDRARLEGLAKGGSAIDAFLAEQLDPASIDDTRCEWRLGGIEPLQVPRSEHYEFTPEQMLLAIGQSRIIRAVYSRRQLHEVMVEFWTDHLNIVASKGECRWVRFADELEVVRPHALGRFRDLIRASATSPAMLIYLDGHDNKVVHPEDKPNENYARELLELHTLGVDGGYTQQDVINVARALTGWTLLAPHEGGGYIFRPGQHDAEAKLVLGHTLKAGRGEEDGEEVLDIVSHHPSTAHYIALKLARRFVADTPGMALVDRAAAVFTKTDGDIREVVRAIVTSPEFFARSAFRSKVKTPFEYVVSIRRAVNAPADTTPRSVQAAGRLGQPLWGHLTPNGWPETADQWVNTGALLNRINLATQVANGGFPGIPKAMAAGFDFSTPAFQRR